MAVAGVLGEMRLGFEVLQGRWWQAGLCYLLISAYFEGSTLRLLCIWPFVISVRWCSYFSVVSYRINISVLKEK